MKCDVCGDEITNENGGSGTDDYAICHNCCPPKITTVSLMQVDTPCPTCGCAMCVTESTEQYFCRACWQWEEDMPKKAKHKKKDNRIQEKNNIQVRDI